MTVEASAPDKDAPGGREYKHTLISAEGGGGASLTELWKYRHLMFTLVGRNVRVRYKNTTLGVFWIVLQPALQMMIYNLIFGMWARVPAGGLPYSVFVLSGLVQVFFINAVVGGSAGAVRSNSGVSKKIYFPKIILPPVVILSALVDYGVALGLLALVMLLNGAAPPVQIVFLPAVLASLLLMLGGVSLWFTALGVRFRDIALVLPAISMFITYMSPVIYPITMVPERFHAAYAWLNPFVGYVTALKWCLAGVEPFKPWMLGASTTVAAILFVSGLFFFLRTERNFNDYL